MSYTPKNANGQNTMANSSPVVVASDQSSIPISGTVTANIGTGNLAGITGSVTVKADTPANQTNALKVDGSATTQPVSGTVTANAGTGNFTVTQSTASNLKVDLSGTAANATAIKVDNSAVTQPISATALPLPTGAATSANQTTLGSQTTKINDGTNTAAVKAASTAAVATDPALVVAISPNNTLSLSNTDLTASISIAALSATSGSITTLNGQGTYVFQLTGTWTATLQVQITADGTNWLNVTDSFAVNSHTLGTFVSGGNITSTGIYQIDSTGLSGIRLIATAYTSGTVTGTARASVSDALTALEGNSIVQGASASGTAKNGNPLQMGGVFNTTTPTVTTGQMVEAQYNNRGSMLSLPSDGVNNVAVKAASTAAATTDPSLVVSIAGANSATKIGDGTNNAAIKAASTAAAFTDPALTIDARPGGALLTASAALGDAVANPTLGRQAVHLYTYNGTTHDLTRSATSVSTTTGDTGAKTATGVGNTVTNTGSKGVELLIILGTVSGTTPTCVFKLQGSVDNGTTWYDIPSTSTASLTATGNFGISIYPGNATVAGTTTTGSMTTAGQTLPRTWRLAWTIGGTTPSFTITSVTFNYHN